MSESPNYVTLEKYIELMNNFVNIKTEIVNTRNENLEIRLQNYHNYINFQKEKEAAILEERARFDELSLKIIETSEHLEKKFDENNEKMEKKINESCKRIDKMEIKVDNMVNMLEYIATNMNNITELLEKSIKEKENKISIDHPLVPLQHNVREQEVFIDDYIDKLKILKEHKQVMEMDKFIIYLNKYKILLKFIVERTDYSSDYYTGIQHSIYANLTIMKAEYDDIIKWPFDGDVVVKGICKSGESWGETIFDDKTKSWRNKVTEGEIGEESDRRWINGEYRSNEDFEDEILFGNKLKLKIEIK